MTVCTRRGCTKNLRKDNAKGVCSSNCLSPEAPLAVRAHDVEESTAAAPAQKDEGEPGSAMKKFREVAEVVGLDADKVLEEFAQSWLDGLREKLEG
ncbi:MAG: hypothetical protein Q8K32_09405 [Archangium sp.]|nr:hypothetical protein [Archangium sp.]